MFLGIMPELSPKTGVQAILLRRLKKGEKMKKHIFLLTAFLGISILFAGCGNTTQTNNHTIIQQEKIELKEYTYDEIYCRDKYADNSMTPVLKTQRIFPAEEAIYLYAGSPVSDDNPCWHTIYTREDGSLSILHDPFCYDPLCGHDDISCLSYAMKGSSNLIPFEDKIYCIAMGKPKTSNFIEYSFSTGKYNIMGTYEAGGEIITRLGRFLYFTEQTVTGQDKFGKQESVLKLYRYDLETGKTDSLGERSSDTYFGCAVPYGGEIYYLYANQLYKCDYNLSNAKNLTVNYKIKIFEIRDDTVWFLTETGDKMGELYRMDLSGGEAELLYENVTWFCLDGDTLYYSLYDPVDAFEWDIWRETKDGSGKTLVSHMITAENGNTIYRIALDKAGKKGTAAPFCDTLTGKDFYLASIYAIYHGRLFGQFKEPYSDGTRKGMTTGIAVIDLETGEIIRITSESFFQDNQIFPYNVDD